MLDGVRVLPFSGFHLECDEAELICLEFLIEAFFNLNFLKF